MPSGSFFADLRDETLPPVFQIPSFLLVFSLFYIVLPYNAQTYRKNTYCLNKKNVSVFLGCHNSRKMFPVFVFNMLSPILDQVGDRR